MGRPSIFSRDYEKKMKKRKRRIFISVLLLVVVLCIGVYKLKFATIDFGEIKQKIQAWVDSDKPQTNQEEYEPLFPKEEEPVVEEKPLYMEVKVNKNLTIKAEYKEEAGKKTFQGVENAKKISFDISPSGEKIVVLDKSQDMYLVSIDGSVKDITKKKYVSSQYGTFLKANILKNTPKYIWHKEPKFIDNNTIIYISCVPYFAESAVNKYFWIYDIKTKSEKTIWDLKNPKLSINERDEKEKGIIVTSGQNQYIIDKKGNSKKVEKKDKDTNADKKDNKNEEKPKDTNKENN